MYKLPNVLLLSSLLIITAELAYAETADSYVDALSSEATNTKMKPSTTEIIDDDPDPVVAVDGSENSDALASKVSNELEKLLTGSSSENVKKEDLANIVSGAVKEGHDIDAIQNAVSAAMAELQKKEGVDITPEVFEFAAKSVTDIVVSSKDVAQGDPSDPYIQSLNAEVDDTSLKDDEGEEKAVEKPVEKVTEIEAEVVEDKPEEAAEEKIATTVEEPVEAEKADVEESKPTESVPESADSSASMRTIIVLRGESLSKIAAKIYGSGRKYNLLYEANKDTLNNPNDIAIGQVLRVPPLPTE